MKQFLTIVVLDFKQRTRNYAFLVTLCASLAIAYTFVPEPNANYSTIRIADYVGYYNSAWFGYVTAIMTSIFLSLIGFYLINSGIKNDIRTKVGYSIASTSIKTSSYLLSKLMSNFLLLLTIVLVVFAMSILLFFLYNDGYPFEFFQFVKPYVIITLPALFFIAALAVTFEICFGKYQIVQNVLFFFAFSALMVFTPKTETEFNLDVFGSKIVIDQLEEQVRGIAKVDDTSDMNIGYVLGNVKKAKKFEFKGIDFPTSFYLSRFVWMVMGVIFMLILSPIFHRFNLKENYKSSRKNTEVIRTKSIADINLRQIPKPISNFSIFPLFKTECLMLFRKGKRWLWLLNITGMLLLAILPLEIAHQMVLPILWFFQVHRISDITTKEQTNRLHYFTSTAYKPIKRLMLTQLVSSILIMFFLAFPLVVRLTLSLQFSQVFAVVLGAFFLVLLSALMGILSKGKKLFEIVFFITTYANINGIPAMDYFGGFNHGSFYTVYLVAIILTMITLLIIAKRHLLKYN